MRAIGRVQWNTVGRWIGLGLVLLVHGLYTGFTSGQITNDEAWFLQVLRRVAGGERLYRDVFFGVTPLSIYLGLALVRVMGVEIAVVKLMMAAAFMGSGLLTLRIAKQVRLGRTAQTVLSVTLLAYTPSWLPGAGAPYTPLAYFLLLAVLSYVLGLQEEPEGWGDTGRTGGPLRQPLMTGAMIGVLFATKQNLGLLTLAAGAAAWAYGARDTHLGPRKAAWSGAVGLLGFTIGGALLMLPVLSQGGGQKLLEYGFLNRGFYVQVAGVSYIGQMETGFRVLAGRPSGTDILQAYWGTQYFLPFICFPVLLWRALRSKGRVRWQGMVLGAFSAAGLLAAFPRVDLAHMLPVLPLLLLTLAWGLAEVVGRRFTRLRHLIAAGTLLWAAAGNVGLLVRPLRWAGTGKYEFSPLAHLTGPLLPSSRLKELREGLADVQQRANDETLFFLSPSAGLYYLLTERENPTPFDYPLVTAFGFEGQVQVRAQIERGEIEWVCWKLVPRQVLRPALLEAYVAEEMELVLPDDLCNLYRNGSRAGGRGSDGGGNAIPRWDSASPDNLATIVRTEADGALPFADGLFGDVRLEGPDPCGMASR